MRWFRRTVAAMAALAAMPAGAEETPVEHNTRVSLRYLLHKPLPEKHLSFVSMEIDPRDPRGLLNSLSVQYHHDAGEEAALQVVGDNFAAEPGISPTTLRQYARSFRLLRRKVIMQVKRQFPVGVTYKIQWLPSENTRFSVMVRFLERENHGWKQLDFSPLKLMADLRRAFHVPGSTLVQLETADMPAWVWQEFLASPPPGQHACRWVCTVRRTAKR